MNFLFPITGAILQASSFVIDKVILGIRRTGYKLYLAVSFSVIFLVVCVFSFFAHPGFRPELFQGWWGAALVLSILLIASGNIIYYRALEKDFLTEIQTIDLLQGIVVIVFSSIAFSDERNWNILAPALVASAAVVWSHWKNHHFSIAKNTSPYLIWSLFIIGPSAGLSKLLLSQWDPLALQLVRSGAIAAIMGPLYGRSIHKAPFKVYALIILTNILSASAGWAYLTSYKVSGIVFTILLFSLQPLLVYAGSVLFLKEPAQPKKRVAFVIVIACIIAAQMMR